MIQSHCTEYIDSQAKGVDMLAQTRGTPPESIGRPAAELVVRRLLEEGFSQGRLDVCDELVADDGLEHQDFGPEHAPGSAGVRAVISSLRRAFSDFRLTIDELVVAGDTVWTRNTATGTHDGVFMGHPPTGRSVSITVFDVFRVAEGRIVEHWGVPDRLGVLLQVGAIAPPTGGRTQASLSATTAAATASAEIASQRRA